MAIWSRLFSGIFGVGVGIAAADAVTPVVEVAKQEAWAGNANRVLDVGALASLLAQGLVEQDAAEDQAKRQGYDADKLLHLAAAAQRTPSEAEARALRHRRKIDLEQLHHVYAKAQIEPQYWDALDALLDTKLSPEVVAIAIVRGLIPDPGILPVPPPVGGGVVPKFPVFDVDAEAESESSGLDITRLSVLAGIAGRPMSPEAAAEAYFKGIIELEDFQRAVSESDVRNEWRDAILANQRFRLRPADWAGLWLRGWVTEQEAYDGGADYGASPAMMRRLYENRGRPATPRQVHLGYARGATHAGSANEDDAIATAVKQSDIRAEWEAIEAANRWSYPSPFVLRQLTQAGVFSQATTEKILLEMGWKPEYAAPTAQAWAATPGQGARATWASRAQTQLWTATHKAFMRGDIDEDLARVNMDALGVAADDQNQVVALWDTERGTLRKDLTQAQVLKLYRKAIWPRDLALTWLLDEGMTDADANALLDAQ